MTIVISMEGGLVQQVSLADVPKELEKSMCLAGLIAEIRNYDREDVACADAEDVKVDSAGNEYLAHLETVVW